MDLTDKNLSPKKLPDRKKRLAKGCTTLMYSCQQGKSNDVVTELRIKPKSIYRRDKSNKSALHYCCGQLDLVAAASITTAAPDLLDAADEDGLAPLHLAVIQGNMALVNLLLANKANVDAVDNEGHSVVHWATVCGEVDALRAILAAGADISQTDLNGGSPLHYAAQMSNGAGFQSHSPNLALEILDIFLQQPNVQVDVCDKDGRQPLLWAASAGATKAVLMLVKAGARVESADKDGLTALHCAASRGHTECIGVLINLCGAPTDLIDSNGCTALHYAVTLGHADATYILLDLGADPNRQDRKGRTPAHCGCAKGQFETVKMLRDRKANLWLRNAKGDLPLHEAAASGRRELVLWLLDQRPKHVNTTSNDGRTILHIAAGNDYTDMCKMLIDFGADINSIYRLPGNVVQTPLDCALSKGFRSTAKYLQLHGGLPANKLRLSGRNPNALNDQELVTPLSFGDSKRSDAGEMRKATRNVVLYVKQSDSETNDTATSTTKKERRPMMIGGNGEKKGHETLTVTHGRKSCDFHRHYHHHYRHRCRRRTSSCERIEILQRDSGPDSATEKMCRSKSNVEICMFRRKRSKGRREPSTSSTSSEVTCSEDGGSSSESYCRYGKSARRKRDGRRSVGKEKANGKVERKSPVKKGKGKKMGPVGESVRSESGSGGSGTVGDGKKNGKKIQQKEKLSADSEQQVRVETKRNEQIPKEKLTEVENDKKNESLPPSHETRRESELPVATPTKRDSVEKIAARVEENGAPPSEKTIVTVADVHTPTTAELDAVLESAAEIVADVELAASNLVDESATTENSDENATAPVVAVTDESSKETPIIESGENVAQQEASIVNDGPPAKQSVENDKVENAVDAKESTVKFDEKSIEKSAEKSIEKSDEKSIEKSVGMGTGEATDSNAKIDDRSSKTESGDAATTTTTTAVANASNAEDASKSFQVLPNSGESNANATNNNQGNDDTDSNLMPPKPATETIRKTSFTVLKSDESADDILGVVDDSNQNAPVKSVKVTLPRPKSFKVLSEMDASGADILLQQSSDQEKSGNEDDDDYLNGNALANRSGKYSDSELIKFDGNANGRRKKYKKRAKSSVRQLSIGNATMAGGSNQSLNKQLSRDQDSGFEPSPRAMRTIKASTKSIYTAPLPERPRVGDVIDSRSCSSRFEQRKPGDKNAVNMSTVSQTLQRNIRRYYMEHKLFQHLLELKSLQIRSSKANEPLLVKRAVDDYHKSTMEMGSETGVAIRRYPYKEYTFKNFEIFLYEVLKSLQKSGTNNFQNISDVYLEAERRLSPDYARCKKAMYCTSKTHRCLHAAHAYTGIPCAAYIPMMNHHTMPKYGFGKTSAGSFYLPKICTKGGGIGGTGKCGSGTAAHNTVSLELSHGNNKQLITLPAEKLDNNKRYYVTFTLKDNERIAAAAAVAAAAQKDAAIIQSTVQTASDSKKSVE